MLPCLLTALPAVAQPCLQPACAEWFPADAGAIDVRDYGARGDGHTDDTQSLLAAIAASGGDTGRAIWHDRVVFLPAGTYLVSRTLLKRYANGAFASGMILIGESPERTILLLADTAPGFGDPSAPRAVVMTASKLLDRGGGRDNAGRGEGNDAYENFVENLTVDVGHGNPGAIGIDYLANNLGAIRDVIVRAPAGSGATGIAMLRKWPGPALIQRVLVQGFDVGIDIGNTEYGITLSQVRLEAQRSVGLRNTDNMVSAEDLQIAGHDGAALVNRSPLGMLVLAGGSIAQSAKPLDNRGIVVFEGTRLPPSAVSPIPLSASATARGWLQGDSDWHADIAPWSVPHPPAPTVSAGPHDAWAGVTGSDDDAVPADATAALQAAFATASTVYLRHGTFWISAPLEIPPTLHRLIGMNATLRVLPQSRGLVPRGEGLLRVLRAGPPLIIERLALDNTNLGDQTGIELAAARTVLVRDVMGAGVATVDRRAGGGPAFLEDTCCGPLLLAGPAAVTARQLNTEGSGIRVRNHGAPLAIVGLKTEGYCTAVLSEAGASTDVLGGLLYVVRTPPPGSAPVAAFMTENARLAARFVEESLHPDSHYTIYLTDRQGDMVRDVTSATMPTRRLGRSVPLLLSDRAVAGN